MASASCVIQSDEGSLTVSGTDQALEALTVEVGLGAVAEVLDVVVSGAGSVEYIGSPRIYESVRGAGRIASYKREPGG